MALYFEKEMALNPFPMKRSVLLLLFLVGLVLQGTSALSQSAPKIYFNFGKNYLETFPWNNAGSDPSSGMVFPNLTTDASHQSGINVQLTTSWGGLHFDGATTGDNSGVVPDNVLKEYYWFGIFGAPDVAKFKITGLMPGATYNLKFIGSSVFRGGGVTDNGTTIYQVDSSAVSLYVEGNTSNLAVLNGIECSASGEIDVTLSKGSNTTVGYINGFILELPSDFLYTPPGFSASQNSGDVNLSWADNNTTETGYEVYRANVTEGRPFELLTSTSMNATSYSDQSTEEGYTYQYKIRAVNSGNLSGFSLVNEIVVPHTLASGPITVGNRIYFNANKLFSGSSPWNNGGKDPIKGLRFTNLVDDNGTESAINLELLTSWGGLHDVGASSGDNSGIVPDNVLKEYFWFGIFGAPEQAILKIAGLTPGSAYNIRFVGSSNFHESGISDNGHTVFSVGGHKDSVDVEANVSQVAEVLKVEANSKGELIVAVSKGADAQVGYLNAFILDLPQGMLYASPRFRGEYTTGVGTGLEWDDNNSSETGYEIYRKNVSLGGSFSLLATTASNDTSFLDTSPTINTIYSYKIRAVGSSLASGFSEEIEVRTIPVKKVLINFTKTVSALPPWNNTASEPTMGKMFSDLADENGVNTTIGLQLSTPWGGSFNEGAVTGDDSGLIPDAALEEYYWFGIFGAPDEVRFKVTGLDPALQYNFKFVGSSVFRNGGITDNGTTIYSIGSMSSNLQVDNNTTHSANIMDVLPDGSGEVEVKVTKGTGAPAGYLNALIIELPEAMLYSPASLYASYSPVAGVEVSWQDNNDGETGYEVYRRPKGSGVYALLDTLPADAVSYLDSSTMEFESYDYRVRAIGVNISSTFQSIAIDCIPKKKVYFSFGKDEAVPAPWNNSAKEPGLGSSFKNLKDELGNSTTVGIELTTEWGSFHNQGAITGSDSGVVPDDVLQEYYWFGMFGSPQEVAFNITGLIPGMNYTVSFLGSSVFHDYGITDNGHTIYRVGEKSASLYVEGNTSQLATLSGLEANENGTLEVKLSLGLGAMAGYINALIIEVPAVGETFWAIDDGNWTDPIWSRRKDATSGGHLPDGSLVNIEGKTVTLSGDAISMNLSISENGQAEGGLIINNGHLTNIGSLTVQNGENNKIEISPGSKLEVKAPSLKILPLGNSITHGSATTYSYRYALWKKLIDHGINFDFIGSQKTNNFGSPVFPSYLGKTFDSDHEGHWGWRADELAGKLPVWLSGKMPDIVLLHAGTNDMLQSQSVASTGDDLRNIIDILRSVNPSVKIILAKLIPNINADVAPLNELMAVIASEKTTLSSPILLIDQFSGFSVIEDTYDGNHPNPQGEDKMAEKWLQGILTIVDTPSEGGQCGGNVESPEPLFLSNATLSAGCKRTFVSSKEISLGGNFSVENGASSTFTGGKLLLDGLIFQYKYDGRRRMTHKKVPGADWIYMVYDNRDRLVMTQDGNQRLAREWAFTKYDTLNRPVVTGIYTHPTIIDQGAMSALIGTASFCESYNGQPSFHGYTNEVFPTSHLTVHTVTYYDDYKFVEDLAGDDYKFAGTHLDGQDVAFNRIQGQVTGTKVRVLGTSDFLWGANYYDDRYRLIQNISTSARAGVDSTTNIYDFTGKILRSRTTSDGRDITRRFTYDHAGRLLDTWHQINAEDSVLLSRNVYNELGQLVTKKLYSENEADFQQNVDYRYNIRGWLTRINNSDASILTDGGPRDYFGESLFYNDVTQDLGNDALFNGNISAMKWTAYLGLGSNETPTERAYTFSYDTLNRLKSALHHVNTSGWNPSGSFHEKGLKYDLNGNIKGLNRTDTASLMTDELSYIYSGNQLLKVIDNSGNPLGFRDGDNSDDDYAYDPRGNMILDKNKSISSITYNHLNLPDTVTMGSGEYIRYIYDGTGRKLGQEVYDSGHILKKKSDYAGEFFYENDTLKFISHEEGRVVMTGDDPEYQYHLKGHLGNVRLTFTTKEQTDEATATLETSQAAEEGSKFLNYAEVRKIDSRLFDHTDNGTTHNSVRLMGGTSPEVYGLAKSISVMPGDSINAEVYVKYLDPEPANWSTWLLDALASLTGVPDPEGTFVDGGAVGNIDGAFPFEGMLVRDGDNGTGPKAYLNYLYVDRNYKFITGGFRRVSTAAREAGDGEDEIEGIDHERLFFENISITEPGYVYIYLSNENETPVEVFFDDLNIEHIKSPVVQVDDYYPFGLTFNSYQRENSVEQRWKFQGQEHIDDLALNWDSFKWRNHQPDIGRFFNIDPLAEKYYYNSPYAFSENKVVAHRELEGLEAQYYMGSNPLSYMAEGFRQYFDAALSFFSGEGKVYTNVSGTKVKASSGNVSIRTTTNTETKAYVKVDFSGVMDNNQSNTPSPPQVETGTKTTVSQTTEAKVTVTPAGVPVNLSASNTVNATDQTVTNKVEASVGVSEGPVQGKVYVNSSTTTQSDGASENTTNVGLKVETPVYNDGQRTISIGAQVELKHKTN